MKSLYAIPFIGGLVSLVLFLRRQRTRRLLIDEYGRDLGLCQLTTVTPAGLIVRHQDALTQATIDAFDEGFLDLTEAAKRNGYVELVSATDFPIYAVRPERPTTLEHDAAVNNAGTWVNGYLSEQSIANGAPVLTVVNDPTNLTLMRNIVRHEAEHLFLYHADRPRFTETLRHDLFPHPILV